MSLKKTFYYWQYNGPTTRPTMWRNQIIKYKFDKTNKQWTDGSYENLKKALQIKTRLHKNYAFYEEAEVPSWVFNNNQVIEAE